MKYTKPTMFALCFLLLTWPAFGASPNEEKAQIFVEELTQQALRGLLNAKAPYEERKTIARRLLVTYFDVQAIARFTLGFHWRHMSDTQKARWYQVFENTMVALYTQKFSDYTVSNLTITDVVTSGQGYKVKMLITVPEKPPITIDWKVFHTAAEQSKIFDVFIEDISMSMTQRAEFMEMIQKHGSLDEFMDTVEKRAER